jgi:hypothetical protein
MNSGIVAMPCSVDPRSMTSNMTAIPEAATSGRPMSPSIAMPRGTKPDDTSGSPGSFRSRRPRRSLARSERPIIDRDEILAESGVCAGRAFLPHEQERKKAPDPDGDECASTRRAAT